MRRLRGARLARWAAFAVLAVGVFEACSSSQDSTSVASNGPPTIEIAAPAANLACDGSLVVHVKTNWTLLPPGKCGTTPECGTLRVTLLETADGPALAVKRAATSDVQFSSADLVTPQDQGLMQVHVIKAELFDDALQPLVASAGGQSSAELDGVSLLPAEDCTGQGGASNGGASAGGASAGGSAVASGAPTSEGGAAGNGAGGAVGETPNGGAAGDSAGGSP